MSTEPFIGEIKQVGFNFAPRGYATCDGQLLSIEANMALFSLLGVTYGGDGRTTFGLPDLRGRVPIHQGQGPGLSNYVMGERSGAETHTLNQTEMPAHNHGSPASATASATAPTTSLAPASPKLGEATWPGFGANNSSSAPTGLAGGSQPHNNMQPYLVINYVIALEGIFPSRN
jgi:microcystin-dependent protein